MRSTLGPYDPPTRGFCATIFPATAEEKAAGLRTDGTGLHIDGQFGGPISGEIGPGGYVGPHCASTLGRNRGGGAQPLFVDREKRLAIGRFSAFVGVSLCDQTVIGRGQLAVIPGAYKLTAQLFRQQREAGGPVGPEGLGWPRVSSFRDAHGQVVQYMNLFPDFIRDAYPSGQLTEDGRVVPKPEQVLLAPGDAVVTLQGCPHTSTPNRWTQPRWQIYFRLRHQKFNHNYLPAAGIEGGVAVTGRSDHPDRGWRGEFLPVVEGATPSDDAIGALCNPWDEWEGMATVAQIVDCTKTKKIHQLPRL